MLLLGRILSLSGVDRMQGLTVVRGGSAARGGPAAVARRWVLRMRWEGFVRDSSEQWLRRLAALGACVVCVLVAAGAGAQPGGGEAPGRASFAYREAPEQLVLRYVERPGELGGPEAEHSVSVYGDGRVVAHRPRFAKRSGSWATTLDRSELEGLLRSLLERGIVEFDEAGARRSRRDRVEQSRLRGELYQVSDADTVTVELYLDRYRGAAPGAREQRDVVKRIRWRGLRSDLRRHPEQEDLQRLGEVHGELRALMERPDLRRLASPDDS